MTGLLDGYERHYSPSLARLFELARCPVEHTGAGTVLEAEDGRRYLDFSAGYGVFALGHLDPRVQGVAQRQLATFAGVPPGVPHAAQEALATHLAGILPGDLNTVLLAGSGTEAVEIALRAAFAARPGRHRLVAARHSYHGKTLNALAVLGQRHLRAPFEPLWTDATFVPFGDVAAVAAALDGDTVAVLLEPILGGGYLVVPPGGYLAAVADLCRRAGCLLIVDEVQTGFGRTGTMFAVEREDVVPDLMIVSKGLTGGHVPMAATAVADRVARNWDDATWARVADPPADVCGSVLACVAASAAIAAVGALDLPARAARQGARLLAGLAVVADRHPAWVRSVRGRGLMAGIELRSGLAEYAIWLRMLDRGVLTGFSTNSHARRPVLRFFPPLIVSPVEIDEALAALDDALTGLGRTPAIVYDAAALLLPWQYRMPKPALRLATRLLLA
ncbi:aspartate aminotransferase family protein [Asanoa sp. NPDC049573]|uniref:aspartate aminotransferase family protein n=1 Tax=Asanoa sp. NPDC049573 TaxID=3155396 RepID=UPI00343E2C33